MSGSLVWTRSPQEFNSEANEMNLSTDMSSREELEEEFIPHIRPTQMISDDTDIQIKLEAVDYHNMTFTPAPDSEADFGQYQETLSLIPHVVGGSSVKTEENDLKDFYLDLLQCDRGCETCQMYMRILSEHVRSTHRPPQPTQDPLYIDPLNIDPDPDSQTQKSSSIHIKREIDENVNSSQDDSKLNSESDPDFESQSESESDTDPDYNASHKLTQKVHGRGSVKKNASSDSKKGIVSSKHQFKCNDCNKGFSTNGNLSKHRRIHTGERPQFKCNECEKNFTTKSNLVEHKKSHTGEKPFQCDSCEKSFTRLSTLKEHQRIHTGEKRFKCDLCEKTFVTSSQLNEHKRVHTGEKPYDCTECKKGFRTLSALKGHVRIHTGERLHKCKVCEKCFARTDHLTKHMRSHRAWKMEQV